MQKIAFAKYNSIEKLLTTGVLACEQTKDQEDNDILCFMLDGFDTIINKSELETKTMHTSGFGEQVCFAETIEEAVANMRFVYERENKRLLATIKRNQEHIEAIDVQSGINAEEEDASSNQA